MKRIGYLGLIGLVLLILAIIAYFLLFKSNNTAPTSQLELVADNKASAQESDTNEQVIDLVSTLNQKINSLEQTVSTLTQTNTTNTQIIPRQYNLRVGQTTLDISGIPIADIVDMERNGLTMLADEYSIVGNLLMLRDEAEQDETVIIQYLT